MDKEASETEKLNEGFLHAPSVAKKSLLRPIFSLRFAVLKASILCGEQRSQWPPILH